MSAPQHPSAQEASASSTSRGSAVACRPPARCRSVSGLWGKPKSNARGTSGTPSMSRWALTSWPALGAGSAIRIAKPAGNAPDSRSRALMIWRCSQMNSLFFGRRSTARSTAASASGAASTAPNASITCARLPRAKPRKAPAPLPYRTSSRQYAAAMSMVGWLPSRPGHWRRPAHGVGETFVPLEPLRHSLHLGGHLHERERFTDCERLHEGVDVGAR